MQSAHLRKRGSGVNDAPPSQLDIHLRWVDRDVDQHDPPILEDVGMTADTPPPPLPYIYRWDRQGRKGQPCELIVRGKAMNSCAVRFPDGYSMVTSRNALRKNKEGK